jgi:hypothetical protein
MDRENGAPVELAFDEYPILLCMNPRKIDHPLEIALRVVRRT